MDILFEDSDILVVQKPAGLPTQTAGIASKDIVSEIKNYLKTQGNRDLYVGLVHRLDQPVEGVLVFGKNSFAAAALSKQVNENKMQKYYYAAVEGVIPDSQSDKEVHLTDYLFKDAKAGRALVVTEKTKDAKKAELSYQAVVSDKEAGRSLLKIHLLTGRFHQIRAQLSHMGYPIINDTKYGNAEGGNSQNSYSIGLCAYHLEFCHPKTKKLMKFEIEPGIESIRELWAQLPD